MKKVLITGAFGQLGAACLERFNPDYELLATDTHLPTQSFDYQTQLLDITDLNSVEAVKNAFNPEIIINLAAMTDVDGCEREPIVAREINAAAVQNLFRGFNGHFIQLSTDYVFDGLNGPYGETDVPHPINVYGRTKAEADQWLLDQAGKVTIVRANVIFGMTSGTKASFVKWVVEALTEKKPIRIVNDQINNPTWTVALADVIETIIRQKKIGIYHYGGAEFINRYEFALKIAEIFDLNPALIAPITTNELNQTAARPLKSGLRTKKVEKELGIHPISVETCLRKIRLQMNP